MNSHLEYYPLGNDITAFTTDRTIGRDPELLCPLLGVPTERFARPHQVHTDRIIRVTEDFFSLPTESRTAMMDGIDAVISNVSNACLGISTADCIPVLVYDEAHHCAAAIHAGWKGTVSRIVEKAVQTMQQTYGTIPSQCKAAIGPGISFDSFEIGDEVYETFHRADLVNDAVARRYPARHVKDQAEKWHLDLKEINRQQLTAMGIATESIIVSAIDTFTDERFFSARREQKGIEKCGRLLTGFVLR